MAEGFHVIIQVMPKAPEAPEVVPEPEAEAAVAEEAAPWRTRSLLANEINHCQHTSASERLLICPLWVPPLLDWPSRPSLTSTHVLPLLELLAEEPSDESSVATQDQPVSQCPVLMEEPETPRPIAERRRGRTQRDL